MVKGSRKQRQSLKNQCMNLREFVGKTVCITDSREMQWRGEILKIRTEENDEDSVIVKLPYGHIVFWESDIHHIIMYEKQEKEAI